MNLLQRPKRVRKDQTAHRIPIPIRAMRIKFAALIAFRDIQLGQVACSGDLNKVGCLDEMGAFDGAIRDKAGAIAISETPGYFVLLRIGQYLWS